MGKKRSGLPKFWERTRLPVEQEGLVEAEAAREEGVVRPVPVPLRCRVAYEMPLRICGLKYGAVKIERWVPISTVLLEPHTNSSAYAQSSRRSREKYRKEDEEMEEEMKRQDERLEIIERRVQNITGAVERARNRRDSDRRGRGLPNRGSSSRNTGRGRPSRWYCYNLIIITSFCQSNKAELLFKTTAYLCLGFQCFNILAIRLK